MGRSCVLLSWITLGQGCNIVNMRLPLILIFGAGCTWTAGRLLWDWLQYHDKRSIDWAAINTAEGIVEDEWHNLLDQARRREEQRQQVLDYYGFDADPTV